MVRAIDTATVDLEAIAGDGWRASNLHITLGLAQSGANLKGARLTAGLIAVEGIAAPLRNVTVNCPAFQLESRSLSCAEATVDAVLPELGRQRFRAALTYELASGALDVRVEDLNLGKGKASGRVTLRDQAWTADVQLKSVNVGSLLALANTFSVPLPVMTAEGTLDLELTAHGKGAMPASIDFRTTMMDLTTANETGTLASDKLAAALSGHVEQRGGDWDFAVAVQATGGQAYAEPVFLDLGIHHLVATAAGSLRSDGRIAFNRFAVDHSAVLKGQGSGIVNPASESMLEQLDVMIEKLEFPGAYASYLQPFLLDTAFKQLETIGTVAGHIVIAAGVPQQVELTLDGVSADDGTGKFAFFGLHGNVAWRGGNSAESSPASRLAWEGGLLLGLDLGPTTLDFRASARDFELLKAIHLPVLDGALEVGRFRITSAGLPDMAFALDADILPVSVRLLSRAFGWPEFGGQLAGKITDLRLEDGILTLATTLQAQVFDGRIEVSDLRLEQPFSAWPRLYSSIGIYNLDLEQVTSAFSFGLITGRLSGYVNEMVLFNWMPVEFDLRLYTPPEDRSKHRISQRAVQNIGNIGGGGAGIGAALSSGFMSFFDEFNYARLGISCRLQNEICLMDGVDPAPNGGYYLVKGKGLPRIDVIGNATQVDWPRLVAQLEAIAESEGPVVQ